MATALSISVKSGFYEKVVISMLSKMKLGNLQMSLPSGEMITFGNGEGNINAHVTIKTTDFFKRCVLYGDIGFGESYVNGDWETDNISSVIKWFLLNVETAPTLSGSHSRKLTLNILKVFNKLIHLKKANTIDGSKENISAHYDLNNDFFKLFLDPTITYSSAYFKEDGMSLQQAQVEKYERLCRKLRLKPSDHVLEIGTGWGGNAIHIAKKHGCKVTTVTISEEQYLLAKERVKAENLEHKITVLLKDYRFIEGKFDKIVSIEMLEAVGHKFLEVYFKKCNQLLKKDGLLALQVITCPDSRYDSLRKGVDWIQKHIFPGSLLPSVAAINKAINNTCDLTLVDLKDIGLDYAKTLSIWKTQFNQKLQEVKQLGFDETFIRKWNYYLCYCEAAFEMRNINTMQLVYSRPNNINW
ncbi:MAG TPA: cyclopropane-fatty-acyl-phospholipid synthase family protein [Bacteroidia bacterium]|nr:cyclopropane-fatty-acyl-phospholipid synthase family protein [Bacteroidia bacterium]